VPRNLRPIFRDRDDFAGGRDLSDVTEESLRQSDFLILLCSPDAARSPYVNEEVRLFKELGGADRIIPVIIAGEPGDPTENCFPDALVYEVDETGVLTNKATDPLAADARDVGDGPRRALAKVIAGLLGIPFDEIVRRAEKAQRRRTQIIGAVAAVMCVLAVAAAGMAWLAEQRRVTAERNYDAALDAADSLLSNVGEELIRTEGIRLETTKLLIERSTSIFDQLQQSLPDAQELKLSKASALFVFAKAYLAKGDQGSAATSMAQADDILASIAAEDPETPGIQWELSKLRVLRGGLLAASGDMDAGIDLMMPAFDYLTTKSASYEDEPDLAIEMAGSALQLSYLLTANDRFDEAKAPAAAALKLINTWKGHKADDFRWPLMQVMSQVQTALVAERTDDVDAALVSYEAAADLAEAGARTFPGIRDFRDQLASILGSTAVLMDKQDRTDDANAVRQRMLEITRQLVAADAEGRRARMSEAQQMVGAASDLFKDNRRAEAVPMLRQALDVLKEIAEADPANLGAALTYDVSLMQAALDLNTAGLFTEAAAAGQALLELREAALAASPDDLEKKADLASPLSSIARALEGSSKLGEALLVRRRLIDLAEELAASDPDKRLDLADSRDRIGTLLWWMSRRDEAVPHFARKAEVLEDLWRETPGDTDIGIELGQTYLNLGELRTLTGDGAGARVSFIRCLDISAQMQRSAPADPARLTDLAWAEARMAQLGDDPAGRWPQIEKLLEQADRIDPLGDREDELLTVARISQIGKR
jgi:tetratricopeptide (TPR) repeat protein